MQALHNRLSLKANNTAHTKLRKTQFLTARTHNFTKHPLISTELIKTAESDSQSIPKRSRTSRKARTIAQPPFIRLAAKTSYTQRSAESAHIRLQAWLQVWLLRAAIYTLYWRIAHRPPRLRTDFISRLADRSRWTESGIEASYENLWRRHVCGHRLRTRA